MWWRLGGSELARGGMALWVGGVSRIVFFFFFFFFLAREVGIMEVWKGKVFFFFSLLEGWEGREGVEGLEELVGWVLRRIWI